MRRCTKHSLWLLALFGSLLLANVAHASELEQRVKAAFLYNVAKFVEWPVQKDKLDDTLDFCILQDRDFAELISDELEGKIIGKQSLRVHAIDDFKGNMDCQVFFVGADTPQTATLRTLAMVQNLPILTVGESSSFTEDGGVLRLKWENSKLRFEIAMDGVQKSRLRVSSKLLRLAEVIPATLQ